MCGIAGFWGPPSTDDAMRAVLGSMNEAMRHRGPDAQAHWTDPAAGLGLTHARLSIIDLSEAGAQPMAVRRRPVHRGLQRRDLQLHGHPARAGAVRTGPGPGMARPFGHGTAPGGRGPPGAWKRPLHAAWACSPWPSGTRPDAACPWCATAWASSPCTTAGRATAPAPAWSSARPPRRFARHPDFHAHGGGGVDLDALCAYLRTLYVPAPLCIHKGLRQLEPGPPGDRQRRGPDPAAACPSPASGGACAGWPRPARPTRSRAPRTRRPRPWRPCSATPWACA